MSRFGLFAMRLRYDGDHPQTTPLRAHGRFHDDRPNSAGGDYDEGVIRSEMKSLKDLLGIAFVILQIERWTQSVCPHDGGVVRERQLYQGHETREAALAWSHFLAHHPGMAVAKEKNQATARDAIGAKLGGFLYHFGLSGFQFLQRDHGAFVKRQAGACRVTGFGWMIHEIPFRRLRGAIRSQNAAA